MAELVDAPDSKSGSGNRVWVQVPLPAPPLLTEHERLVREAGPKKATARPATPVEPSSQLYAASVRDQLQAGPEGGSSGNELE